MRFLVFDFGVPVSSALPTDWWSQGRRLGPDLWNSERHVIPINPEPEVWRTHLCRGSAVSRAPPMIINTRSIPDSDGEALRRGRARGVADSSGHDHLLALQQLRGLSTRESCTRKSLSVESHVLFRGKSDRSATSHVPARKVAARALWSRDGHRARDGEDGRVPRGERGREVTGPSSSESFTESQNYEVTKQRIRKHSCTEGPPSAEHSAPPEARRRSEGEEGKGLATLLGKWEGRGVARRPGGERARERGGEA
eukprot:3217805-Rhodomonas_salina.1